jgi:hypothetical protein
MTNIGAFTVGEVPFLLTYQFLDSAGDPIDLTGYTSVFQYGEKFAGQIVNPVENPAGFTSISTGIASYQWDGTEFQNPGLFVGQFWVTSAGNVLASEQFEWTSCLGVDVAPTP